MSFELKLAGVEIEVEGLQGIAMLFTIGVVCAAVLRELNQPASDRTWHGRVLGFVPYDFRTPTPEKVKDEFWNPESDTILAPHAFGVGWGVNFGAIAKKLDLVA